MGIINKLEQLRALGGAAETVGLSDTIIEQFAASDPSLEQAVDDALEQASQLRESYPDLLAADESEQIGALQAGFVNFYADDAVNPYVALSARGPWIITSKGAVLHDSGGYGMLGFGHAPTQVLTAMNRPHVMANVMTASFTQLRLVDALRAELGHSQGACPFAKFLCLNSGSEAVTAAARISDINAKMHTDPQGAHAGKHIKIMSLAGGFHGRTDRPAQFSDSTRKTYKSHLASFRDRDNLITVVPNDVASLEAAFAQAEKDGVFIESFFMEPVMGEGNPGEAISREFYEAARKLTKQHGALLLVDSIQAGLRAQGCLSIVDYPGFEGVEAPDMETYSKALNAGQYPLSVLAMTETASNLYRKGVYGNTMTTNPRAMDVAVSVLASITPEIRDNIRSKGKEFVTKLEALASELDGQITKVQGTGLLFSCEVSKDFKAYGTGSLEEYLRKHGIGVIHGGENSLRFTPHFGITSDEVDLIVAATKDAILNGPRREVSLAKAG